MVVMSIGRRAGMLFRVVSVLRGRATIGVDSFVPVFPNARFVQKVEIQVTILEALDARPRYRLFPSPRSSEYSSLSLPSRSDNACAINN